MDDLQRFTDKIKVNEFGDRHDCTCKVPKGRKRRSITYNGRRLRVHQVVFLITFGFIPPEISHRCHNGKCIEISHLLNETTSMNLSRNSCKKKLEQKQKIRKRQVRRAKRCYTLRLEECDHEPSCFLKIGKV